MQAIGAPFDLVIPSGGQASNAVAVKGDLLNLSVPALTSNTFTVQLSMDGVNFYGLRLGELAAGTSWSISSFTGAAHVVGIPIAGAKFVRVHSAAAQGADRVITAYYTTRV
ncbi:MAG: hypothetical protein RQ731_08130 [Anaerosomatales bacterium]|nr:hypothetical protein [Anaerosomatales bacterium]